MARGFMLGEVSSKAAGKYGLKLGTRAQASKMAEFDDKAGRRDQGGRKDTGATAVAGSRHIDSKQAMKKWAPSKGGSAGAQKQPIKRGQIDDGGQRPKFPKGTGEKAPAPFRSAPTPGGARKVPGSAGGGKPSSRGAKPMQKGGYYSASSSRP